MPFDTGFNIHVYQISESACAGITYEPTSMMWTLRTSDVATELCGAISYLKECINREIPVGVGRKFLCDIRDIFERLFNSNSFNFCKHNFF